MRWKPWKPLALAAALVATAAAAQAPPVTGRGQIRGEVTGADGRPLVGISIVLSPVGRPDVVYVTSTDEKGLFALDGLVPETYQVQASGQGVRPVVKDGIRVKPPFRAVTALSMEPVGDGAEAAMAAAVAAAPGDEPGGPETSGPVFGPAALAGATQPLSAGDGGATNMPLAMSFVSEGRIDRVRGTFVDAEGKPVTEGSITLRRLGVEKDVFYCRTDAGGRFELRDIPAGLYDITTRSPGLIPLHLRQRSLPAQEALFLSLVAPDYPLAFRGYLDDLLPEEVPRPPPAPRQAGLAAGAGS
jgi:hypothetical protein